MTHNTAYEQFEYFKANREKLMNDYFGRCIVIKNRSVIADYASFDEAYEATIRKEKLGSFIIHECVAPEDEYFADATWSHYQLDTVEN
jgi:hypothetical protein